MGKLEDILDVTTYTAWENDCDTDRLKQQIKALMLEVIGEDESTEGYAKHNGERMAREDRNQLRAELRQKVEAL